MRRPGVRVPSQAPIFEARPSSGLIPTLLQSLLAADLLPRSVRNSLRFVVADALGALADPTRRRIFELVAERPRPVGELATPLPVTRPAVSQHLRVLRLAGLVLEERAGTRHVYRVDPAGLDAVRRYFEAFWERSLALVEPEHRHLDRRGAGLETMRDAVDSPNGWSLEGSAKATAPAPD